MENLSVLTTEIYAEIARIVNLMVALERRVRILECEIGIRPEEDEKEGYRYASALELG